MLTLPFSELRGASQVGQVAACLKARSNLLHAGPQTQALSPIQATCMSMTHLSMQSLCQPMQLATSQFPMISPEQHVTQAVFMLLGACRRLAIEKGTILCGVCTLHPKLSRSTLLGLTIKHAVNISSLKTKVADHGPNSTLDNQII